MLDQTLRDWYCFNYMSDPLGMKISKTATFQDLTDALKYHDNVVDVIGVDSDIIFERLNDELEAREAEMSWER